MIQKLTRTIVRTFAFALALCATGQAWAVAPTPVAEWDGDFTATQTGFTLDRSGNAISQNNSTITIDQDVGVKVDFTTGFSTAMTVMFKYSDLSFDAQKTLATSYCSGGDENRTGVYAAKDSGTINGIWNTGTWNNPMGTLSASSGVLAFCYSKSAGTSLYYVNANGTRTQLYNKSNLVAGGDTAINGCTIGGERAKTGATLLGAATDMKITGIAIFDWVLSQDEMEGYTFPSDDPTADFDYVATITENTTLGDITTWTKGSGTPEADSKVYIISEDNAVLTINGSLSLNTLKVVGGSITLANGASISSTEVIGADINIAASTEVTISDSTVWSKISCNGKLNTNGDTEFSNSGNNFAYGSEISVVTGTTTVNAHFSGYNSAGRGLHGNITIAKDAEFVNSRSEVFDCNADANHPIVVDVSGTLSLGSTRWTLGNNNKIVLHEGGRVEGNGDSASNGAFDLENNVTGFTIEADGNAEFAALVRIRNSATLNVDVAADKTLTFSTKGFVATTGKLNKIGDGTLENTINSSYTGLTTVSAGKIVSTAFPAGDVSIASGATYTLKNLAWTEQPSRFTGTGTLELRSESASCKHTVTGVTFPGIIKLSNVNTHNTSGAPYWQNNIAPASADMFAADIRPEFILDSDLTHLGDGYYCNNPEHPLRIKNLSGSGEFRGQWSSSVYKYVVETLQERNTTYDGTLGCDASGSNPRCVSLSVIGNNPSEIHSLTITQAINGNDDIGCQTSTLTVADDAKVVFASTGKWGYGNIIVNEDGWLESTNTTAAANITLNDGSTIVVPYVNSATVPLGGTTVTLPADGTVYFDMNGVNIAGGTTVTVISATTLNNGSTASFEAKSGKWDFNVVGNTVTATKKVLSWDGSSWSDDDYSGYTEASIAVSGEASVTLPATLNLQKMTLTGSSGSLTIVGNNNTLTVGDVIIPNGVTLVASSALTITGVVSGGGSLVVEGTNLTVYDGKTWTVNSVVVNGTLTLGGATSSISGTVTGAGKIVYPTGAFPSVTGLNAAGWTGKVEIPSIAASRLLTFSLNSLGNTGSTVVLKGIDPAPGGNYQAVYPSEAAIGLAVNPTLQIDGYVSFTFGYSAWAERLKYVTGSGDLLFDYYDGSAPKWHIETLTGFSGSLGASVTYGVELSIGTLALVSGTVPTTADRLVKISNAAGDNWANIINVENTVVTVGGEATEYKLVKKNAGTATAGLYLAPAVIKDKSGNLTPYESVDAAFTALSSLANDAYDYVAVYDSATVTFSDSTKSPKIKTVGDGVTLTLNSGYGDYGWAAGSPGEDGVVTYSFGPIPATYTWVGAEDASWFAMASWQCGGAPANRFIGTTDNAIFSSDASVTISANYTVASITNSANVAFTATSAQTITVGDGGVVMTALGNSITLTNVTLSKVPTTTAATLAVQTTGGGEDPTVYTVVNSVASVDGVGYATIAEASEALKTSTDTRIILQQDYDGAVTIYPGKYLVQNGYTVTSVVGADTDGNADDGIVVTRYGNSVANYYWSCVDQRTATWSGAGSAYWTVMGNWVEQFTPTTYTAVTIPATEGHATAITLSGDVSIKSLTLGAGETLTLSRSGETARTFTTSEAIVLTSGQTIVTGVGVSISPAITTEDANSYVKSVISDGVTTYTVADHKATVYDSEDAEVKKYDTVADAVSAATDGQKVTLFANSNEAITLNGKSITFNEGSYTFSGTFTGNGTVVLTSTLKSAATARWAEGWTGTVVLPANQTFAGFNFDNYGRVGSTVQLQGTNSGWLQYRSNNDPIATTIEIPNGASLTITGWSPSFANGFDVIKGAGTFAVAIGSEIALNESSYTAYFLLKDVSNFTGSFSASGAGIAIGDARIDNSVAGGKIIVSSGKTATVGASATWTAGTIEVNGNVSVASGGALSGTIAGSGEISLAALVNSAMSLGDWTGTVELPAISETVGGFRFDYYGKAGSTVKISKGFTGWLNASTSDAYQVKTRILVTGCTFTISGSNSGTWYQIAKLSGDGNFSFVQSNQPNGFHIGVVENFTGTISNSDDNGATPTVLTITRLNVNSDPTVAKETKVVTTTTASNIAVGSVYYDEAQVDLSHSLSKVNKADGIYLVRAGTIFLVY